MLHLGFSDRIDLLSWIVVLAAASKVLATAVVLLVDRSARDRPGWGSALWWITKVTPLIMVSGLITIALLQHNSQLVRLSLALGVFVIVAVPVAIRQRRRRMAHQLSAG